MIMDNKANSQTVLTSKQSKHKCAGVPKAPRILFKAAMDASCSLSMCLLGMAFVVEQ